MAEALGAPFVDLDSLIESAEGRSIEAIFAADGEEAFRSLEVEHGLRVLAGEPAVIAPGGGFAVNDRMRLELAARSLVAYLVTPLSLAARRLAGGPGRPLLKGADPAASLCELLRRREPCYLSGAYRVSTEERGPHEVAAEIVKLARSAGGW